MTIQLFTHGITKAESFNAELGICSDKGNKEIGDQDSLDIDIHQSTSFCIVE